MKRPRWHVTATSGVQRQDPEVIFVKWLPFITRVAHILSSGEHLALTERSYRFSVATVRKIARDRASISTSDRSARSKWRCQVHRDQGKHACMHELMRGVRPRERSCQFAMQS